MTDDTTPQHAATQVAYPWRAALRTGLATLLALLLALPAIASILTDTLGGVLPADWLAVVASVAAGGAAVATAITRIMVIPAVSELLTSIGLGPVGKQADQ